MHMDGERISASGVGVQKMEVSSVHIAAGQLQWIHVVCKFPAVYVLFTCLRYMCAIAV